jgi:hypothetical protein
VTRTLLIALVLVRPLVALADDDDPARLGRLLQVYAEEERRERLLGGATGLVSSSLTIATGAYLLGARQSVGPTWVALAGWLDAGPPEYTFVRSLVYLILPGPLERLNRRFGNTLAAGTADLTALEQMWQAAAARARAFRWASTAIYAAFAAGTLGYGAWLIFSGPLDRPPAEGQYIIGAELIVAGLAHGAHALHDALIPSAVERAWRARGTGPSPTLSSLRPFAVVGPTGAFLGIAGRM